MFVVEPSTTHTHTIVLLHGLGSNGAKFGQELLDIGVTSSSQKLAQLFPYVRFVFPTSKPRRSSAFGRSILTQWFDIARLNDPSYLQDRQLQGLEESGVETLAILAEELKRVPAQNLILGGLSQGCAMSLAVLLCLEQPIGGYIGMSGYSCHASNLSLVLEDDEEGFDPFGREDGAETAKCVAAQTFERELLNISRIEEPSVERTSHLTPVLMGHGELDEKVPLKLGEAAAGVIRDAGYDVDWKCYAGQGHWYKIPEQIDDIVNFITDKVGWEKCESSIAEQSSN